MILLALALLTATPANLAAQVAAVKPGDTIQLADADYPPLTIRNRTFAPPLTITGGRFTAIVITGSTGVTLKGQAVTRNGAGYGINITASHGITVADPLIAGARNAMNVANSTDIEVTGGEFIDSTADGMQIAGSQRVTVDRLVCHGSKPNPGAHPDCVQIRSGGVYAPLASSYITVSNSMAEGDTQGFDMFGNTMTADHIVFDNLTVVGRYPRGISMDRNCTPGCRLTNSRVTAMRGSKYAVQMDPLTPPPGWDANAVKGNSGTTAKPK